MKAKRQVTNVQITKAHAAKLDRIAAKAGINRSTLMRLIIDKLDPALPISLTVPTVSSIQQPAETELAAA